MLDVKDECCGGCVGMSDKGVGPGKWQVGGRNEMLDGSDDWLVGAYAGCWFERQLERGMDRKDA